MSPAYRGFPYCRGWCPWVALWGPRLRRGLLAAATGDENARKARERVAARMTREQIAEAHARARANR